MGLYNDLTTEALQQILSDLPDSDKEKLPYYQLANLYAHTNSDSESVVSDAEMKALGTSLSQALSEILRAVDEHRYHPSQTVSLKHLRACCIHALSSENPTGSLLDAYVNCSENVPENLEAFISNHLSRSELETLEIPFSPEKIRLLSSDIDFQNETLAALVNQVNKASAEEATPLEKLRVLKAIKNFEKALLLEGFLPKERFFLAFLNGNPKHILSIQNLLNLSLLLSAEERLEPILEWIYTSAAPEIIESYYFTYTPEGIHALFSDIEDFESLPAYQAAQAFFKALAALQNSIAEISADKKGTPEDSITLDTHLKAKIGFFKTLKSLKSQLNLLLQQKDSVHCVLSSQVKTLSDLKAYAIQLYSRSNLKEAYENCKEAVPQALFFWIIQQVYARDGVEGVIALLQVANQKSQKGFEAAHRAYTENRIYQLSILPETTPAAAPGASSADSTPALPSHWGEPLEERGNHVDGDSSDLESVPAQYQHLQIDLSRFTLQNLNNIFSDIPGDARAKYQLCAAAYAVATAKPEAKHNMYDLQFVQPRLMDSVTDPLDMMCYAFLHGDTDLPLWRYTACRIAPSSTLTQWFLKNLSTRDQKAFLKRFSDDFIQTVFGADVPEGERTEAHRVSLHIASLPLLSEKLETFRLKYHAPYNETLNTAAAFQAQVMFGFSHDFLEIYQSFMTLENPHHLPESLIQFVICDPISDDQQEAARRRVEDYRRQEERQRQQPAKIDHVEASARPSFNRDNFIPNQLNILFSDLDEQKQAANPVYRAALQVKKDESNLENFLKAIDLEKLSALDDLRLLWLTESCPTLETVSWLEQEELDTAPDFLIHWAAQNLSHEEAAVLEENFKPFDLNAIFANDDGTLDTENLLYQAALAVQQAGNRTQKLRAYHKVLKLHDTFEDDYSLQKLRADCLISTHEQKKELHVFYQQPSSERAPQAFYNHIVHHTPEEKHAALAESHQAKQGTQRQISQQPGTGPIKAEHGNVDPARAGQLEPAAVPPSTNSGAERLRVGSGEEDSAAPKTDPKKLQKAKALQSLLKLSLFKEPTETGAEHSFYHAAKALDNLDRNEDILFAYDGLKKQYAQTPNAKKTIQSACSFLNPLYTEYPTLMPAVMLSGIGTIVLALYSIYMACKHQLATELRGDVKKGWLPETSGKQLDFLLSDSAPPAAPKA